MFKLKFDQEEYTRKIAERTGENLKIMSKAFEEKEEYKHEVLQTLKNIKSNTVGPAFIVDEQ